MKPSLATLLALTVVTGSAGSARANCEPGALDLWRAWPANGATEVPTSAHVLVHVLGTPTYLAHTPDLVLRAATGETVALTVVLDVASGTAAMQQRTLVYRPERLLAPSATYTLEERGTPTRTASTQSFTTGSGPDVSAPSASSVTAGAFARVEMGCGPSDEIALEVHATDDTSLLWLRLAVAADEAALAAGRIDGELILPVAPGETTFGHGMCIGNWPLEPGDRLVARATVLDSALHEVAAGDVVLDAR